MKQNSLNKKTAFTLAEVLVTMIVIAVIALATTWALPKQALSKKKLKVPRGSFACTNVNGQLYVYSSTDNKVPPAIIDKNHGWTPVDECEKHFSIPTYAETLSVYVIGGGGGGSAARVISSSTASQRRTFSASQDIGTSVNIKYTGNYRIRVTGFSGTSSHIGHYKVSDGDNFFCDYPLTSISGYASAGYPITYGRTMRLEKGDVITTEVSDPGSATGLFSACGSAQDDKVRDVLDLGQKGKNITLRRRSGSTTTVLATLTGSGPGKFECKEKRHPSCDRYLAKVGSNGGCTGNGCANVSTSYPAAGFSVELIDAEDNNVVISNDERMTGPGGSKGAVKSTIYPMMEELTNITITPGAGGTGGVAGVNNGAGGDGGQSCFREICAGGGKGASIATNGLRNGKTSPDDGLNGIVGTSIILDDHEYLGGAGGTGSDEQTVLDPPDTTVIAGKKGTGFGTGGGGGALYTRYEKYRSGYSTWLYRPKSYHYGNGGDGAGGLIWIFW